MPMDFPDLKSLERAAQLHGFRKPLYNETEDTYRELLADHVAAIDLVESEEIRNKVGWDRFNEQQNRAMITRSPKNRTK